MQKTIQTQKVFISDTAGIEEFEKVEKEKERLENELFRFVNTKRDEQKRGFYLIYEK